MDVGISELRHGFSKALCHTTRCPRQFTVTPMLSPPGHVGHLDNSPLLKTSSPPCFLAFFLLFFFLPPNMLLQQPQHFISAQGNIHLEFSCSMETRLSSPSFHPCSEREKLTPPFRARWTMGSTPARQRQGGGRCCGGTLSAWRSTQKTLCNDQTCAHGLCNAVVMPTGQKTLSVQKWGSHAGNQCPS